MTLYLGFILEMVQAGFVPAIDPSKRIFFFWLPAPRLSCGAHRALEKKKDFFQSKIEFFVDKFPK
jgi:hypothetical protein